MGSLVEPQSTNPQIRLWAKIAAIEERVNAIERNGPQVPVTTGAPGAATGREGSLAGDTANKIWLRVNGVWKSVAVA